MIQASNTARLCEGARDIDLSLTIALVRALTRSSLSLLNYLATGFQATLTLLPGNSSSTYGPDITPLLFTVELQTANRLHVMITDPNNARYQVPQSVIPRPTVSQAASNPNYALTYTSSPFGFAVTRKIDGTHQYYAFILPILSLSLIVWFGLVCVRVPRHLDQQQR